MNEEMHTQLRINGSLRREVKGVALATVRSSRIQGSVHLIHHHALTIMDAPTKELRIDAHILEENISYTAAIET